MPSTYSVDADRSGRYLRLGFKGHMDMDSMVCLERDLQVAFESQVRMGNDPECCRILVDAREQTILSQDVAARLQEIVAKHAPSKRKTALVVSDSALQKMQVKRVAPSDTEALFFTEAAALSWLLAKSS